jgi:hypothetical protein
MSRKQGGGKLPDFVPLIKSTMRTPAWRAMSHGAKSLYVALKCRYHTRLQNAVYLSARVAAKELGSHKDYITRWHRELQYYGFTVIVRPGHLGVEGKGKAAHLRLTECWYQGHRRGISSAGTAPSSAPVKIGMSLPKLRTGCPENWKQ